MIGFQAVTAVAIVGALLFGMVLTLPGRLQLPLTKDLQLGEERVSQLLLVVNLSLLPLMLVSGILCDALGVQSVLLTGSFLTAGALFLLGTSITYLRSVAALFLIAAGGACLGTAATVLMPPAFFPTHPAASLNLGYVFCASGAFLTPFVADLLLRRLVYGRVL